MLSIFVFSIFVFSRFCISFFSSAASLINIIIIYMTNSSCVMDILQSNHQSNTGSSKNLMNLLQHSL